MCLDICECTYTEIFHGKLVTRLFTRSIPDKTLPNEAPRGTVEWERRGLVTPTRKTDFHTLGNVKMVRPSARTSPPELRVRVAFLLFIHAKYRSVWSSLVR